MQASADTNAPATRSNVDALVERYAPRVRWCARRYARGVRAPVTQADLVSAGFVGLVDALSRFDDTRVESLDAFVDQRVRGAILDELRRNDPLTRDQRALARRMSATSQRLANTLGHGPSQPELAEALGVAPASLHAAVWRMHTATSAAALAGADDERFEAPGDERTCPATIAESHERGERLSEAYEALPPRHQEVLRRYYKADETLREIAESLGVTESRVWQIHKEALKRLRVSMADC